MSDESTRQARVEVRCLSTLSRYQPEDPSVTIEEGETPQQLLERLSIPRREVNLVFINREQADWGTALGDGDRVGFVPLVSGG